MTTTEVKEPAVRIIRFWATQANPCTKCGNLVVKGTRAGYVGGPDVECEACLGGPDVAALPQLCTCSDRSAGFTKQGERWVHAGCLRPAHLTDAEREAAENEAWVRGDISVLDKPEHAAVAARLATLNEPVPHVPVAPEDDYCAKGCGDVSSHLVGKCAPAATKETDDPTPAEPVKPKRRTRAKRSGEPGGQQPTGPTGGGVRTAATQGSGDGGAAERDPVGDHGGAAASPARGGGSVADQPAPAPAAGADVLPARLDSGLESATGAGTRHVEVLAEGTGGVLATEGRQLVDLSPAAFMTSVVPAAPIPSNGNTAWAAAYARELRDIVVAHANRSDRNLQVHLGPSEIGHACDRSIAAKLAQLEPINHVRDPWASIMGVAGHTWMEECLSAFNEAMGPRFLTEFKVNPGGAFSGHPGTGDGYDKNTQSVIDHKFLGKTSMEKLRQKGAPRHYFVQTLLYARGFAALGLPVHRVALLAWPRTESYLDNFYVWEHVITEEDQAFLDNEIAPELAYRKQWAAALVAGTAQLLDVPADSTSGDCHFCEMYRPASARDGGPGCPGDAVQH